MMDIWQLDFLFSKYVGNRMQEITQHKFCVFLDTIRNRNNAGKASII